MKMGRLKACQRAVPKLSLTIGFFSYAFPIFLGVFSYEIPTCPLGSNVLRQAVDRSWKRPE